MTPEQRRKNKRVGIGFLIIVVALFAWTVGKQVVNIYFP